MASAQVIAGMGRSGSLFERLGDRKPERPLTITENTNFLADSVLAHLRKMLNTRQGHALIAPEYGMPDVTEFAQSLPESVDRVRLAIKDSIEKYEPRLRKPVRVIFVSSEEDWPRLRFEIVAGLITARERVQVRFETIIETSGRIDIRG